MATKHTEYIAKDKVVSYYRVKEGQTKMKAGDPNQKARVETGGMKAYRIQSFSIPLDKGCGYINCEYWGEKTLMDGSIIEIAVGYLKQKKGTDKSGKIHSQVLYIIKSISSVKQPEISKDFVPVTEQKEETQNFVADNKEELVEVNEEFPMPPELE